MNYAGATLLWASMGGILVFILLLIGLRGARLAVDVAAPIGGAILVTLAALMIMGQTLSLFHLASLLLLAGLAMDYALFVARSDNDPEATSDDTIGAVLNCAISTLLTFGLLALCSTPVLRGIGLTVSIGVISAFLLALAMSRRSATHG
jgi:predicted exporter